MSSRHKNAGGIGNAATKAFAQQLNAERERDYALSAARMFADMGHSRSEVRGLIRRARRLNHKVIRCKQRSRSEVD